ncbi:hypothetical protein [Halomonas sp. DWK9]|uniref:hypothetical protein n=1 Tax=Halomonas sp. DWK9 TaxID=3060155 RepID=UPI00287F83B1|nr:hypothetical protein [Halomonas sp. DWK9]
MIQEMLILAGGSALLMTALGFLSRSIILHFLNKDFKQFEQRLITEAQKSNFIFEKLYVRKLEAIASLYEQSVLAEQATKYAVQMQGNVEAERIPELEEKVRGFREKYLLARLWLDDQSCEIIDELLSQHSMFYKVINAANMQKSGLGKDWIGNAMTELWEKADEELPKVQNRLREAFKVAANEIKP